MFHFKKGFSLLLTGLMAMGSVIPAFSAGPAEGEDWFTHNEKEGTDSDMHVSLLVQSRTAPEIFSAYVPASITVAVSRNGNIITPENLRIINGVKTVPIAVWDMKVSTTNGWETVPWGTDLKSDPLLVDTKKIAMTMNDLDLNSGNYNLPWEIAKDGVLPLNVKADIPYQSHAKDLEKAMQIVFTLDWVDITDENGDIIKPMRGISLDKTNLTLNNGSSDVLHVTYNPQNTTDPRDITWSVDSAGQSVVKVDQEGKVTAIGGGEAIVTATCGKHAASCKVTVPYTLSGVSLTEHDVTIEKGQTHQLVANALHREAFEWSVTEGQDVVSVSQDGTVTANASGEAKVQVKMGDFVDTCTVHVPFDLQDITLSNQALNLNKIGETATLTVNANPSGFEFAPQDVNWSVDPAGKNVVEIVGGKITTIGEGQAVVTAELHGKTATCTVDVKNAYFKSPNAPVVAKTMKDTMQKTELTKLTGKVTFSAEAAPQVAAVAETSKTVNLTPDGSVVAVINGQDATIYAKDGGGVKLAGDCSLLFNPSGFSGDYKFSEIDMRNVDTSEVTNMQGMFGGCENLKKANLAGWDTRKLMVCQNLFSGCTALEVADLSSFSFKPGTQYTSVNMKYMFGVHERGSGCDKLKTVYYRSAHDKTCLQQKGGVPGHAQLVQGHMA